MRRRSRSRTSTRRWTRTDSVAVAVRRGNAETAVPRLLAMLCILAVFIPSFFMQGAARALFVPLSLAVGFAMIASLPALQHVRAGAVASGCCGKHGTRRATSAASTASRPLSRRSPGVVRA